MKIKELPLSDRPVERLINSGSESLSNQELIAIILKTGTKELSSKELALEILKKRDIKSLADIRLEELLSIKGIGIKKASVLLASLELSKRINEKIETLKSKMNNPNLLFEYYKNKLSNKKQEHFYAVYLDLKGKIIKDKLLFIGTINYSIVSPREIFKEAYLIDASSIVIIHNHPTGDVIPSKNDLETTSKLIEVGNILGIKVLDHIIIGKDKYYSLIENGDI